MNIDKMKKKISDHKDELTYYGILAAGVAVYGAMLFVAAKQAEAAQNLDLARKMAILDAVNNGKKVLPNSDGSFWILD